ncbi:MAG: hypothetical protein HYX60_04410 [Legionella longbeachae]|nr:hypothetical protein [Legionella longbeachae]
MSTKRPIDLFRESGGSFKIESETDTSPIQMLCNVGDNLLMVTNKAVYEIQLADQIDPERENPRLPHNIQRCVLNIGADSAIVGCTLLTAEVLFKSTILAVSIDTKKAKVLAFEALKELAAMKSMAEEFSAEEENKTSTFLKNEQKNRSLALPSIIDLESRTKSFFQKADHVQQILIELTSLFYSDIPIKGHFETLVTKISSKYNDDDNFIKFLKMIAPEMKILRNLRDCLDHRLYEQVKVSDFKLTKKGKMAPPSIIMERPQRKAFLEETWLSDYMSTTVENLANIMEMIIAFLCAKGTKRSMGVEMAVGVTQENRRIHPNIRFGYLSNLLGSWVPMG